MGLLYFTILKPHYSDNATAHSFASRQINCYNELPQSTHSVCSLSFQIVF